MDMVDYTERLRGADLSSVGAQGPT